MYITPLLLSAVVIDFIVTKVHNNWLKCLFAILVLISIWTQLMVNKYNLIVILTAKDTRTLTLEYLKENGITKDNSVYEAYTPLSNGANNTDYNLDELNNNKGNRKYVILSSGMYSKYLKEDKDGKYKKNIEFYNTVIKLKLINKFQSKCPQKYFKSELPELRQIFSKIDENCVVGPEIKIYSL